MVGSEELYDRLYFVQNATGAVMAPLEAFLASRGLKTLELRVHEQCRTAHQLAEYLDQSPHVRRVLYPGLPGHPGHELAKQQMAGGFGAMLSFEVEGDFGEGKRVVESTRLFQLAVSLGAVESLIEQPQVMSYHECTDEQRKAWGIPGNMIRLSCGIENTDDLVADLEQALEA